MKFKIKIYQLFLLAVVIALSTGFSQENPKFSVQKMGGDSGVLGDRDSHSQLLFGPDGHLYATRTLPGEIWRYKVDDEGVIVEEELLLEEELAGSGMNGIEFDLNATESNLVFYYSRVHLGGRLYRVVVAPWGSADPVIEHTLLIDNIGIMGNHAINNLAFGPGGFLYITLAGQDHTGWEGEKPWTSSVARVDLGHEAFNSLPIDISSPDVLGDTIYTGNEPVQLYVTGVRNGQGLHYHTNGYLYGTIHDPPSGPIPIPGEDGSIHANLLSLPDLVARYEEGKYYGHTNPSRGQRVYYGGNPTSGVDPFEVPELPVGTLPDTRMDLNLIQGTDVNMCIAGLSEYSNGNLMVSYMKERGLSIGYVEWFNLDEEGYFANPNPLDVIDNHSYIEDLGGNVIVFGGVLDIEVVHDKGWVYIADWGLRAGDRGQGDIAGIYLLKPDVAPLATKPMHRFLGADAAPVWSIQGVSFDLKTGSRVTVSIVDIRGVENHGGGLIFSKWLRPGHHVIPVSDKLSDKGIALLKIKMGGDVYYIKGLNLK